MRTRNTYIGHDPVKILREFAVFSVSLTACFSCDVSGSFKCPDISTQG